MNTVPSHSRAYLAIVPSLSLFLASATVTISDAASSPLRDSFDTSFIVEEVGSASGSTSPDWWLNSGAYFHRQNGIGTTIQGTLPQNDRWRLAYASSNPRDTDDGYRPQNVFRLITRGTWQDFDQQVYFRIQRTNLSDSPERDAWSGVLLFVHYKDGDNLYYAGLRMDGTAVIKKKRAGTYTTLGQRKIYPGTYNRSTNPTLLPQGKWVGLRSVTSTGSNGSVRIRLEVDDSTVGPGWTPVLEIEDTGTGSSGAAITGEGFAGIRIDFMDVQFEEYSAVPKGWTDAPDAQTVSAPLLDPFDVTATIEEAGSISASGSANWWVSSGARFVCQQGVGTTLQGTLPSDDTWRTAYASSNPLDTEDGYRPQNVFRMVTRGEWEDLDQQVSFRIQRTNLTDSPNRDAWNGVQLFHRYFDENNLYILGVRVDGVAAIKKKRNGVYTTLGYKKLYAGTYDRWARPNLLPQGTWVGIRGVSTTTDHGTVMLRIEVNDPALGSGWTPVIETEDTASDAIATPGHGGIRVDFMDVQFDSYSAGPAGASSPTPTPTSPSLPSPTPTPSTPLPTPTPTPSAPQPTPTPTAPPASTPTPAAASCTITLSPLSQWFGSTGGGGTVAVVTSSSCSWTAVSDRSWIKIVLGSFGTGNGIVTYEVGATRKRTRSGAIHVGDVAFTITQSR